jgi:pentapeptide MXKDX repeat protein
MRKLISIVAVLCAALSLSLTVVGCSKTPANSSDKMGADKMDKMDSDKMKGDKMQGDKMDTDKMEKK